MTKKPIDASSLRSLWQTMPTETMSITAEDMRFKAQAFERRMRRRNIREYSASGFVIVVMSWYATFAKPATPLWPVGCVCIILATLWVTFTLYRRARSGRTPNSASVASLIDFHRNELIRHRDLAVSAWRWYVLPFMPGFVLMMAAMWVGSAASVQPKIAAMLIAVSLFCLAVCASIILLNLLAAARLQRMIDDLDRYKEKP